LVEGDVMILVTHLPAFDVIFFNQARRARSQCAAVWSGEIGEILH
jgi:hypothetical protein